MKTIISTITILILLCPIQNIFAQKKLKKSAPKSELAVIVSCGVCNQEAIYLPKPEYPKSAQVVRASGAVNVEILIDEKGDVESAKAVSGHLLLHAESVKAALKAKFKPFTLSGNPVKVKGTIVYKFADDSPLPTKEIFGGILNGKAVSLPKPDYPQEAKDFCVNGKVEVEVKFHAVKGEVISAKAISGDELLRKSAENAAMQAKFAELNVTGNRDFYITGIVVYNFVPEQKCIEAKVVNKKALSIPKPKVTNLNKTKHLRIKQEEVVEVQIIIELWSGKVIRARAISGHPMLRVACENSARQAKFSSVHLDLTIRAILVYKFNPNGKIEF